MAYYKIESQSELFTELGKFLKRIDEVKDVARELIKTIPNAHVDKYYMAGEIAGGIRFIGFPKDKIPEDWCKSDYRDKDGIYCYPHGKRKSTKEIRQKIKALPRLDTNDLNDILKYKWIFDGKGLWRSVGIMWGEKYHLIDVHDASNIEDAYVPISGMIELTSSEYMKLKSEIK